MSDNVQTNRGPIGTKPNRFRIDKETLSPTQNKSPRQKIVAAASATTGFTCGPDVTLPLIRVLEHFESSFNKKFSDKVKDELCSVLAGESLIDAIRYSGEWWDIIDLYRKGNDWIHLKYRKYGCASKGARIAVRLPGIPFSSEVVVRRGCGDSVQVGKQCHYAGSVNYVFFGTACRLCYQHYVKRRKGAGRLHAFTPDGMKGLISLYKPFAANLEASKQWANAGWHEWLKPKGSQGKIFTPKGDRCHCKPACRKKRTDPFAWHLGWYMGGGTSGKVLKMQKTSKGLVVEKEL